MPISGAKNSALTLLPCALLTDEPLTLRNLPRLADVDGFGHLLNELGVSTSIEGTKPHEFGRVLTARAGRITSTTAPYDIVRKMRASILVLGPLLARAGEATVSLPGGCAIGNRPIDLHLKALEALGATIELASGYVRASAPGGRLPGGDYRFPVVSVGATENALMAAVLAEGTSVLSNCAREPEIVDLCQCLNAMGARIGDIGRAQLTVDGVERLHGTTYAVMPDRIEAGSYACAAAITGGDVLLAGARADDMRATLDALTEAGVTVEETSAPGGVGGVRVAAANGLKPVRLTTAPFPGFATDMQAQFMAMLTPGGGGQRVDRDDLREPLYARAGAGADGRGRGRGRPHRDRDRPDPAEGRPRHGHRPARVDEPDHRRPGRRGRDDGGEGVPPGPGVRAAGGEAAGRGWGCGAGWGVRSRGPRCRRSLHLHH